MMKQGLFDIGRQRRRLLLLTGLGVCLLVMTLQLIYLTRVGALEVDDFLEYWAAGRLNITGGNPYDPRQLLPLQRPIGWSMSMPVIMWNPPWTLSVLMPFGLLSYQVGRAIWLMLHLMIVLLSASFLWAYFQGPERRRWLALLVTLTFAPVLFALRMGQISPLILLGILGFLYFQDQERWVWAGVAVALVAIKPQLLYLFWVALLVWVLARKRWSILVGLLLALAVGTLIALAANPVVIGQYVRSVLNSPPTYWVTPTLGSLLRLVFGGDRVWLQFVPPFLGIAWFVFYWRRHRNSWDWAVQLPLLLLVCLVTTPYGWEYDQIVLMLAVIQVAVWTTYADHRPKIGLVAGSFLVVTVLALLVNMLRLNAFWFVWMAPTYLLWYLAARKHLDYDEVRPQWAGKPLPQSFASPREADP